MSATYQAVFARCKSVSVLQQALDVALGEETWNDRRIEIGDLAFSPRGWVMLEPVEFDFFLARGTSREPRLARLARALGTATYQVDARGSVVTTLTEADRTGKLRVSGTPLHALQVRPAKAEVGFGLLPVSEDIRTQVANLDGSPRLADYLGELAGFGNWRRMERSGETIYFTAPAAARRSSAAIIAPMPAAKAAAKPATPPSEPAPPAQPPAPAKAAPKAAPKAAAKPAARTAPTKTRRAPASPGRTSRKPSKR